MLTSSWSSLSWRLEKLASHVLSHGGGIGGGVSGDCGGSESDRGGGGTVMREIAGDDNSASSSGMAERWSDKCRSRSRQGEPVKDTDILEGTEG